MPARQSRTRGQQAPRDKRTHARSNCGGAAESRRPCRRHTRARSSCPLDSMRAAGHSGAGASDRHCSTKRTLRDSGPGRARPRTTSVCMASGRCGTVSAGAPRLKMPAFSAAISGSVCPRTCAPFIGLGLCRPHARPHACIRPCIISSTPNDSSWQLVLPQLGPSGRPPCRRCRLMSDQVFPNREARIEMRHLHEAGAQTGGAARRHNRTR